MYLFFFVFWYWNYSTIIVSNVNYDMETSARGYPLCIHIKSRIYASSSVWSSMCVPNLYSTRCEVIFFIAYFRNNVLWEKPSYFSNFLPTFFFPNVNFIWRVLDRISIFKSEMGFTRDIELFDFHYWIKSYQWRECAGYIIKKNIDLLSILY